MKGKILLVDDDQGLLRSFQRLLTEYGYLVRTAGDGRQGFISVIEDSPDLVISDLRMPIMDGLELAERLACAESCRGIPVFLISGSISELETGDRPLPSNIKRLFEKPVQLEALLAGIEQAVFPGNPIPPETP